MIDTTLGYRSPLAFLVAVPLALLAGCANENCHMGEHVGAYSGDLDGAITLALSRVDADDLVDITLDGEEEGFPIHAQLVTTAAQEGCSDLFFAGPLVDELSGEPVGRIDGALTTTTGEGTWTLETGESGTWSLGTL